jgi:hypothetical protein
MTCPSQAHTRCIVSSSPRWHALLSDETRPGLTLSSGRRPRVEGCQPDVDDETQTLPFAAAGPFDTPGWAGLLRVRPTPVSSAIVARRQGERVVTKLGGDGEAGP